MPAGLGRPDEPIARALVRIKGGRKPERTVDLGGLGLGGPDAGAEAGQGAEAGATGRMLPTYNTNSTFPVNETGIWEKHPKDPVFSYLCLCWWNQTISTFSLQDPIRSI